MEDEVYCSLDSLSFLPDSQPLRSGANGDTRDTAFATCNNRSNNDVVRGDKSAWPLLVSSLLKL